MNVAFLHRPFWRGLLYLLVLGPFFFWSYGAANHWAASQPYVPSIVFEWEAHIPLWPWTILPYWSIDLFYGLSLVLAKDLLELNRHAARLLTAQVVCVVCFALWPLKFSTPRPHVEGWAGQLFDALASFDLPFNQAPSLHIVLLLILWDFYRQRLTGGSRLLLHVWSFLIGLSVLTTYQHHFIDIPTGLLAGAFACWLWPLHGKAPRIGWHGQLARWRLAVLYALGAALLAALSLLAGGRGLAVSWWLLWPAVALFFVSLAYAIFGEHAFQKSERGRHSLAVRCLLAPYRWVAWLNARCWTLGLPSSVLVHERVALGRLPLPWEHDHSRYRQLLDLTAELDSPHPGVRSVPMLDLVVPAPHHLLMAARQLDQMVQAGDGPVLVCCALGFSRSASVLATWLCTSGAVSDVDEALATIRARRPQVVILPSLRCAIDRAVQIAQREEAGSV